MIDWKKDMGKIIVTDLPIYKGEISNIALKRFLLKPENKYYLKDDCVILIDPEIKGFCFAKADYEANGDVSFHLIGKVKEKIKELFNSFPENFPKCPGVEMESNIYSMFETFTFEEKEVEELSPEKLFDLYWKRSVGQLKSEINFTRKCKLSVILKTDESKIVVFFVEFKNSDMIKGEEEKITMLRPETLIDAIQKCNSWVNEK